jgi:DNA-binding IclR family transcriptional regulator
MMPRRAQQGAPGDSVDPVEVSVVPQIGPGVKSVEVGHRVLEALIEVPKPLNLSQIAKAAGISRSSARRYLISLVSVGLVMQDPNTHWYSLGDNAVRLGFAALGRTSFLKSAIQIQKAILNSVNETSILSVWGTYGPSVFNVLDAYEPIYMSVRVGTVLPLIRSAAGLVWSAFLPRSVVDPLLERELRDVRQASSDANLPGSWVELDHVLETVRARQLAIVHRSLIEESAAAAVPLMLPTGQLVAVLAVIAPRERFLARENRITDALLASAHSFHEYGRSNSSPK